MFPCLNQSVLQEKMSYGFLQNGLVFFSKGLLFNISLRYFENPMAKSTVCLPRVFPGGVIQKLHLSKDAL